MKVLVRAKTPDRIILVSDASPLAGLAPGRYGDWEVDPSGKIVVAGTPYLAGSNQGIEVGVNPLIRDAGLTLAQAIDAATRHPARLLHRPEPTLEPGQPANLVRFRLRPGKNEPNFVLRATCVDGEWVGPRGPAGKNPSLRDGLEVESGRDQDSIGFAFSVVTAWRSRCFQDPDWRRSRPGSGRRSSGLA